MMGCANNLFQLTKVVLLTPPKFDFLAWEKKCKKPKSKDSIYRGAMLSTV